MIAERSRATGRERSTILADAGNFVRWARRPHPRPCPGRCTARCASGSAASRSSSPEPLDALILQLAATRRGHAALGDQGTSAWLLSGGKPSQPISAFQLTERLRQLGIRSGQSRSAALFQLATDLPAAVLARLLGIHITVAVAWQRASAGDWAAYAAEISRRHPGTQDHRP